MSNVASDLLDYAEYAAERDGKPCTLTIAQCETLVRTRNSFGPISWNARRLTHDHEQPERFAAWSWQKVAQS